MNEHSLLPPSQSHAERPENALGDWSLHNSNNNKECATENLNYKRWTFKGREKKRGGRGRSISLIAIQYQIFKWFTWSSTVDFDKWFHSQLRRRECATEEDEATWKIFTWLEPYSPHHNPPQAQSFVFHLLHHDNEPPSVHNCEINARVHFIPGRRLGRE